MTGPAHSRIFCETRRAAFFGLKAIDGADRVMSADDWGVAADDNAYAVQKDWDIEDENRTVNATEKEREEIRKRKTQ